MLLLESAIMVLVATRSNARRTRRFSSASRFSASALFTLSVISCHSTIVPKRLPEALTQGVAIKLKISPAKRNVVLYGSDNVFSNSRWCDGCL